ncbi:MAG: hypothetical protein N3D71_08445 [Burkholderiaceae bacterium]|nr:hypothetical protein [Burkholderiaceae bacterium]
MDGSSTALALVLASVSGISPHDLCRVPLVPGIAPNRPCALDLDAGTYGYDLDRVLEPAAAAPADRSALAATRWASTPLPQFAVDLLRARAATCREPSSLGRLLGPFDFEARKPIVRSPGVRLRATWIRFRRGLSPLALDLGLHPFAVALVLCDFAIVTRSSYAYVVVPADHLAATAATLYDALGWGPPVTLIGPRLAVGSLTTPTDASVRAYFTALRERVERVQPGRHASLVRLLDHYNAYTDYAAALVEFCVLSRQVARYPLTAAIAAARSGPMPYPDKATGPTRLVRSAPRTSVVGEQIELYVRHCRALLARLERARSRVPGATVSHLAAVTRGANVPLFAHFDANGKPRAIGTGHIRDAVPTAPRLAGDAGRHYFATRLYMQGMSDRVIDVAMRHAEAGVEHLSSTSMFPFAEAENLIDRVQRDELARLGIGPIAGLSRR